jgi:general stress protein 26
MDKEKAKMQCIQLMENAETVYLTTIDLEGFPNTRAMLNLRNKHQYPGLVEFFNNCNTDLSIYFTTNTSSEKVNHILKNPAVSVYYCNPRNWHGVMLNGHIEIINDLAIKKALWQPDWDMYYPEGVDSEDNAVLRLVPKFLKSYYKFERFNLYFD